MATARMYEEELRFGVRRRAVVVFMFLPLAHSLARVTQMVTLDVGGTIAFWRGDPKVVLEDLAETRPTHVPVRAAGLREGAHQGARRRRGGGQAEARDLPLGARHGPSRPRAGARAATPRARLLRARHALADRLVLSKVRGLFGPDIRLALTGAAPIAQDVLEFFDACGVLDPRGLRHDRDDRRRDAEHAAALPLRDRRAARFPATEISIAADGEVLMRGPNIFAGYFRNDDATRETMTDDGWLRSGDLGSIDDDGFLRITGRKKDLIITSSGKNISAANIEAALREIRWVSQAVVYGDNRPYLVALLTLDPDEAPALAEQVGVERRPRRHGPRRAGCCTSSPARSSR